MNPGKTNKAPSSVVSIASSNKSLNEIADQLVMPFPVFKSLQRWGWGLLGMISNVAEQKAVRALAIGIDDRDEEALAYYLKARSIDVPEFPKHVRVKLIAKVNEFYHERVTQTYKKTIRHISRSEENERDKRVVVDVADQLRAPQNNASLLYILKTLPMGFGSIDKAESVRSLLQSKFNSEGQTVGKATKMVRLLASNPVLFLANSDLSDPKVGPKLRRVLSSAIELMIKAKMLEDYLYLKRCPVSVATFEKLLNEPVSSVELLRGKKVQGVVALSGHLKSAYPTLSKVERAAIISGYGFKDNPTRYFEKKQKALADKLAGKKLAQVPIDVEEGNQATGDRLIRCRELPRAELSRLIVEELQKTSWSDDKSDDDLKLAGNRIEKLARKRLLSLEELRDIISEANDPIDAVAAIVRDPKPDLITRLGAPSDTESEIEADETDEADKSVAASTYFTREQRAELREILNRKQLEFSELRSILSKYFKVNFDSRLGPGSHNCLIRERPGEKLLKTHVSIDIRYGRGKLHITPILSTYLQDLLIESEEFIDKLKEYRKLK